MNDLVLDEVAYTTTATDERFLQWVTPEGKIAGFLQKVKFRKQIFGGVSEKDVWTKIRELNEMYRQALLAERIRYDALIAEHDRNQKGE